MGPHLLRRSARPIEAQIALAELIRRLENPRLVQDPPTYRRSPILRGPRHLRWR
jgi:cytochrome P450